MILKEVSFGIIPLQKKGGVWNVLLVKHHSGDHWGFPKGRPIENELPLETAIRELKEETALTIVRYLSPNEITEKYELTKNGERISKMVTYFIAEVSGNIFLDFNELCGGKWVPLFEAVTHITHIESKQVCQRAMMHVDYF